MIKDRSGLFIEIYHLLDYTCDCERKDFTAHVSNDQVNRLLEMRNEDPSIPKWIKEFYSYVEPNKQYIDELDVINSIFHLNLTEQYLGSGIPNK